MAFGKNLILVAGVCIFGMGILAQSAPAQPPTPAPAAAGLTDTPVAPPNNEATRLAEAHLEAIERRIVELTALKARFRRMIDACPGQQIASCTILKALHEGSE